MPVTIKSTTFKYKNPVSGEYQGVDAVAETTTSEQVAAIETVGQQFQDDIEAKGEETIASIPSKVQVSGTTPTITGVSNTQYICGEVATLGITLPLSGCIDVIFESGSTPTILTITPQSGQTMHWPGWFDATSLEANTRYEINIDNTYGVVATWA